MQRRIVAVGLVVAALRVGTACADPYWEPWQIGWAGVDGTAAVCDGCGPDGCRDGRCGQVGYWQKAGGTGWFSGCTSCASGCTGASGCAGGCGGGCTGGGCGCQDAPVLTARVEALLLWRSQPPARTLYGTTTGATALDASDLTPGMAAGARYAVFLHGAGENALEFNYFRVQDFTAARSIGPAGGPFSTAALFGPQNDFPDVVSASAGLISGIQSLELNARTPMGSFWSGLLGFRWVEWRDGMAINDVYDDGTTPGLDAYLANAMNSLYGVQIGGDALLFDNGYNFRIEGIGKVGVYGNAAQQTSSFVTVDTFDRRDPVIDAAGPVRARASQAAFVGELGLTGVYQLNEWLAFRGGYTAIWLSGLALAPNQFSASVLDPFGAVPDRAGIHTQGSVWLQGLNLGLEAIW
jgi:hypothetical protein